MITELRLILCYLLLGLVIKIAPVGPAGDCIVFSLDPGEKMENDKPDSVAVFPGNAAPRPPEPLSDEDIGMIHAGLIIPGRAALLSMTYEIRKSRGDRNPDSI